MRERTRFAFYEDDHERNIKECWGSKISLKATAIGQVKTENDLYQSTVRDDMAVGTNLRCSQETELTKPNNNQSLSPSLYYQILFKF